MENKTYLDRMIDIYKHNNKVRCHFGKQFSDHVDKCNITFKGIADATGIPYKTIVNVSKGAPIDISQLFKLCDVVYFNFYTAMENAIEETTNEAVGEEG